MSKKKTELCYKKTVFGQKLYNTMLGESKKAVKEFEDKVEAHQAGFFAGATWVLETKHSDMATICFGLSEWCKLYAKENSPKAKEKILKYSREFKLFGKIFQAGKSKK